MSEAQLEQAGRDELETLQSFRWPGGLATSCIFSLTTDSRPTVNTDYRH